jgi:hypothetical protein
MNSRRKFSTYIFIEGFMKKLFLTTFLLLNILIVLAFAENQASRFHVHVIIQNDTASKFHCVTNQGIAPTIGKWTIGNQYDIPPHEVITFDGEGNEFGQFLIQLAPICWHNKKEPAINIDTTYGYRNGKVFPGSSLRCAPFEFAKGLYCPAVFDPNTNTDTFHIYESE